MFNTECDVIICLRDINGNRIQLEFPILEAIHGFNWDPYDDETYEILMVLWGGKCIYCALCDDPICMEDLIGFFA